MGESCCCSLKSLDIMMKYFRVLRLSKSVLYDSNAKIYTQNELVYEDNLIINEMS